VTEDTVTEVTVPRETKMPHIDLNADMGESFGVYRYGADDELIRYITSANLACGFHAADPAVMRKSVALTMQHGVAIGAHVGLPDVLGFGRRAMSVSPSDLKDYTTYQIGALHAFLQPAGATMQHVKAHGAMYMMLLEDAKLADSVVEAIGQFDARLLVYTIRHSAMDDACLCKGLRVIPEFFADRPYFADGRVKMFGWTLDESGGTPAAMGERAVGVVTEGALTSFEGGVARIQRPETICVHSDTPGSPQIMKAVRDALERAGVVARAPTRSEA
jgi:UPF0271 protein